MSSPRATRGARTAAATVAAAAALVIAAGAGLPASVQAQASPSASGNGTAGVQTINCRTTLMGQCDPATPYVWRNGKMNILPRNTTKRDVFCASGNLSTACGHGNCVQGVCVCDGKWVHEVINASSPADTSFIVDPCSYEAHSRFWVLMGSIFVGWLGVDLCLLGAVNPGFWVLGVMKGMTLGGLGLWWVADGFLIGYGVTCQDGWGIGCWDDVMGGGAPAGL